MTSGKFFKTLPLLISFLNLFGQSNLSQLVQKCKPSVFSITAYDKDWNAISYGTGFFTDSVGVCVTNFHILNDAYYATVKILDGGQYKLKKINRSDEQIDLVEFSILNSTNRKFPYLKINNNEPKEGEAVFVIGNPKALEYSISSGIVSSIRNTSENGKLIQITAPVSHGSSGSPVINMKGEVVGIVTSSVENGQNLNFATSILNLEPMLEPFPEDLILVDTSLSPADTIVPKPLLSSNEKSRIKKNIIKNSVFQRFDWGSSIASVLESENLNLLDKYVSNEDGSKEGKAELDCYSLKYIGELFKTKLEILYVFKNNELLKIRYRPWYESPPFSSYNMNWILSSIGEVNSDYLMLESMLTKDLGHPFGSSLFSELIYNDAEKLVYLSDDKTIQEKINYCNSLYRDFSIVRTEEVETKQTVYGLLFDKHSSPLSNNTTLSGFSWTLLVWKK